MKRTHALVLLTCFLAAPLGAEIRRNPNGVNVNTQGPSTVFVTFGGLANQQPREAFWCGALIPAAPDIGFKCDPATIYGQLPLRHDFSRASGQSGFTDIMSIPQTVARRAYEAAKAGQNSAFFYVRRFASTVGGPDEYVFVTCRMSGGGARSPLALLDVDLRFEVEDPVLALPVGERPPAFHADITYTGTGRLRGRWEIAVPGDEPPTEQDLLTEATLPVEQRAQQRRYTQLGRFNHFLPPTGRFRLDGPDPSVLPAGVEGLYLILLRVEASDDKEGDTDLGIAGAGIGVVHTGGVAGFPLPVLRYYVGSASAIAVAPSGSLRLLLPQAGAELASDASVQLSWAERPGAAYYRLELMDAAGAIVLSAVVKPGIGSYAAPPWLRERAAPGALRWRVAALDLDGEQLESTEWRDLRLMRAAAGH